MKQLNEKIQFISEGTISDGAGGYIVSEIVELETFAQIKQLKKSRELDKAQMQLPSIFEVRIYDRKDFEVKTSHRVKWRGKIYNIASTPEIDDVRARRFLTFDITAK